MPRKSARNAMAPGGMAARAAALVAVGIVGCTSTTAPTPAITVTMTVNPPTVPAGNAVTVLVTAVPSGGVSVAEITIQTSGIFSVAESVAVQGTGAQSVTRNYVIPGQTPPGPVDFRATARGGTVGGQAQARITVSDVTPPTANGSLTALGGGSSAVPGDTIQLAVSATDNHKIAWVGYRLGAPVMRSDSVAGGVGELSHAFSLVATTNWVGTSGVTVFARDSSGNLGLADIGTLTVVNAIRRPTRTVALAASVRDIAFDSVRSTLYLSQPDSEWVAVLSTATLTFQTPIRLFARPAGLDLSVGGDSLVVALRRSVYLAIVNLTTRRSDTVRLNIGSYLNQGPDNVRVMGNDKAIVTVTFDGSGYGGQVWEYDLVTGAQRRRTDAGVNQSVTEAAPLARAADRSRMLLLIDDSCCPEEGDVYVTAADSFPVKRATVSRFFATVSTDATAAHFLIGESLYDGSLLPITTLTPAGYGGGATVLAPDGSVAYMATWFGYLKARVPDGVVLEQVVLPGTPAQLAVLPTGQTLVAVTPNASTGAPQLSLIDLR